MSPNRTFRLALLAATLAGLAACSSDDDGPDETPSDGGTEVPDTTTPTGGGDADPDVGTDPDEELPTTGIDRTDPNPRIFTSECGSLPVLDTPISTTAGAGATLVEGQLVRGRLEDDVSHYWDVDLEPGYYHVVLDGSQGDDRDLNIGVTLVDLDPPGDADAGLLPDNDAGYRSRRAAFIEVPFARTLRLQATQRFLAEDYVFGVFPNGSDIPSPRFEECPDIVPLSLGTTEVVQITELDSEDAHVWYRAELEAGQYTIDATASQNGTSGSVIYEVFVLDGFGQIGESTETTVLDVSETEGTSTDSATFTRDAAGPVWLRIEEDGAGVDIEFTLDSATGG